MVPLLGPVHASNLTFGNSVNLSNDPAESSGARIASAIKNVYVIWVNNTSGNSNILFRASKDNGTSFGPIIKLSTTVNGDAGNPQIAAVGSTVYVVWQDNVSLTNNDIFIRASNDNGTSFSNPINLSSDTVDSTVPELAAVANDVYVTWQTATKPPDIVFKVSTNRGTTFSTTAKNLSNNGNNAKTADMQQMAASGTNVYVTWRDALTSSSPALTFFTYSSDNGTNFTTLNSISNDLTGDIHQAIAAAGNNVYVTWTNDTASTDNTMFRASTTNGVSFGQVINLYKGNWTDLSPQLVASGSNVYVVWTNVTTAGPQLLFRASNNNGASFLNIVNLGNVNLGIDQEAIAASGTNVYITWDNSNSSNDVYFISSNDSGLTFGNPLSLSPTSGNSSLPGAAIAAAGSNVYVAWEDDTPINGNGDIFFRGTGSPPSVPDVAVSAIVLDRNFTYTGVLANITVTITAANPGTVQETFSVSANASSTILIGSQSVTLAPGASTVVTFIWNTAPMATGTYTLTAHASKVTGETILLNNDRTWGTFTVKLKGDVSGDCKVNIFDLTAVGGAFGATAGSSNFSSAADMNNDGRINIFDLTVVGGNFGASC